MSYTKQTWTTGDTVTATKLNHMEDGIAGAGASYDVVIQADTSLSDGGITSANLHLISGDYATIVAKAVAGNPVSALVYGYYEEDGVKVFMNSFVYIEIVEEESVRLVTQYNSAGNNLVILLDSNDDLTLD